MTGKKIGVGIIGGGLMGREIAAALRRWPALIDHPAEPELVAVCDINPAALEFFERIDTVQLTTTDHHELLADPRVDVVYIAVRHDLHERLYVDTVRAGKALLAEKPFGIDRAAADAVVAAIEENPQSFVRVSSEMPFFPGAQWAVDYVRAGGLGRIVEAKCTFLHSSDIDVNKPLNWKRQKQFCGDAGVLNDLGMHTWHVPLRPGMGAREGRRHPAGHRHRAPRPRRVAAAVRHVGQRRDPLVVAPRRRPLPPHHRDQAHRAGAEEHVGVRGHRHVGRRALQHQEPQAGRGVRLRRRARVGREQSWQSVDAGSQSVWPTVTGPNFESGFSDAILQMWAAFLAEYLGELGDGFGCVRPDEAALTHRLFAAAIASHETGALVAPEA